MPPPLPATEWLNASLASHNYRLLVRQAAVLGMVMHLLFIGVFGYAGVPVLAAFNVLSVATFAWSCWETRARGRLVVAAVLPCIEVLLHATLASVLVGWETGFHYLMLPLLPLVMLASNTAQRLKVLIATLVAVIYMALNVWTTHQAPSHQLDPLLESSLRYTNILSLFAILGVLSRCYLGVVSRAQQALLAQASTDPLTGALNRRRLLEMAQLATARSKRNHTTLSVLLCDIDHFKSVNDQHGHDGGDRVLKAFFQCLQEQAREVDCVARWGGEEFLVLLPDTDLTGALTVAERLRRRVSDCTVNLDSGAQVRFTVTIGVAQLKPAEPFAQVVSRADGALYAGKQGGRNRVLAAGSPVKAVSSGPAPTEPSPQRVTPA
ncbi:GGDEF domain-containing protein [Curvibacter sp. HBC61]|uniref:diguanylate cyclase n=1 Tax=Curvibacter cyanobacteriorum TaxID=3026422 RepID=A0ABT5N791_9BURK|nr:GGDEF domain-containing protein [Curvibacter sp. HBC61]MDD0840968.1 GGDEF domain-containing protein [Curvibacter sp. HBC61]